VIISSSLDGNNVTRPTSHREVQNRIEYAALDRAMVAGRSMIIVEPPWLGEAASRWIRVGNALHKTSVLAAMGCLSIGWFGPGRFIFETSASGMTDSLGYVETLANVACATLGVTSVTCAGVYALSWGRDPCSRYQIEAKAEELCVSLPLDKLRTTCPVVLVRRDDSRRRMLHNTLATAAGLYLIQNCVLFAFSYRT